MDLKQGKKIFKRNVTLTSSLVGKSLSVHLGNREGRVSIRSSMLGLKLGEFFITKVMGDRVAYRKKLKKKKKK
jgi:ribosomal protein S19